MKKLLVVLATLAVVVGAVPSAHAQVRPHVSKREWHQAQSGMSMAKVHRLFGITGHLVDSWPEEHWQARTYRPWRSDIYLLADFVREHGVWRLDSKSIDRDCGRCFGPRVSRDRGTEGGRGA